MAVQHFAIHPEGHIKGEDNSRGGRTGEYGEDIRGGRKTQMSPLQ